jgi:thymidine kinase
MPYYIYKITPGETETAKSLELVREYEKYQTAKKDVRTMRAEQPADSVHQYKIIFSENQAEAEERLLEYREQPIVKEWEK